MSVTETRAATIHTTTESQTDRLGRAVALHCRTGDCITLQGELGAGKTVFSRGFIREITGSEVEVASPTFTLMQQYTARNGVMVWHVDLYRLEAKEEIVETGLEEALEHGMTLIEWPEIAAGYLPENRLKIDISYGGGENERVIRLCAQQDHWCSCLDEIVATYERTAK